MKRWLQPIDRLGACSDALEWAKQYDSLDAAWAACERGDWMLWLVGHTDTSAPYSEARKPLVRVSLACARLAWEWMPQPGRDCVVLHERWCNGEAITVEQMRQARRAVAYNAAATAAAYAAYTAAAAYAAYAVAYNAAAAAAYTARRRVLKQAAAIVRQHYPAVIRRDK